MPLVNVNFSCNEVEQKCFNELCKENNLTIGQGLNILIRQACDKGKLPLEYDYDSMEHVQKQRVPVDLRDCLIPMKEFINLVEHGSIIDYDGVGYLSDGEYEYYGVICNTSWLKEQPKRFTYVAWYNK